MKSIVSNSIVGLVGICAAVALQGCGEVDGDATETVRGELGSFGTWRGLGGGLHLIDSPALAKGPGTTLRAFGWGSDQQIWTTAQNANGGWTGVWTTLPPLGNGLAFASRPAAAAITSGPYVNQFAIMVKGPDYDAGNGYRGGNYYLMMQDQAGNVTRSWSAIQGGAPHPFSLVFNSAPALAFVPGSPTTMDDDCLFVGGMFYDSVSVLVSCRTGGNYWSGLGGDVVANTAPALAFVQPQFKGQDFLYMAAGVEDDSGFVTYKTNTFYRWVNFLPWQNVPHGLFISGPALAGGTQGEFGSEVTLFGMGTDSRVWVTNQVPNGGFSPIGTTQFGGNPSANGAGSKVNIAALINGVPYSNSANSP